jgi:hypothetical protein
MSPTFLEMVFIIFVNILLSSFDSSSSLPLRSSRPFYQIMSSVDKHMRQQLISLTTKLLDETTLRIQCEKEKDDKNNSDEVSER